MTPTPISGSRRSPTTSPTIKGKGVDTTTVTNEGPKESGLLLLLVSLDPDVNDRVSYLDRSKVPTYVGHLRCNEGLKPIFPFGTFTGVTNYSYIMKE